MSLLSIFSKLKNPQVEEVKGFVPYEEIDAKGTSKLGYFFLILMVAFGVWQGDNFFSAVQNTISYPEDNSQCLTKMEKDIPSYTPSYNSSNGRYSSYNSSYYGSSEVYAPSECEFSSREKAQGIPDAYDSVYPEYVKWSDLQSSLQDIYGQINQLEYDKNTAVSDYSVSLLEGIAKKNPVMDMEGIRKTIKTNSDLAVSLKKAADSLRQSIDKEYSKIEAINTSHKADFDAVEKKYSRELDVYELNRFAVAIVFILPLFFLVWRKYLSAKAKRSEFSIIWGGFVAVAAIMVAEITLVFVYDILPHELLQRIFAFLSNLKFIFVIMYWLGFILIPLFFGFLIYIIQKKYYNKKAVVMRAFKANKCPVCTMSVSPHMVFCSTCGTILKAKCASCGGLTPCAGEYCEICGVKKVISAEIENR